MIKSHYAAQKPLLKYFDNGSICNIFTFPKSYFFSNHKS